MNDRIKKLRKALDLTQQEFAERIGSVQNTITGYETGRRIPSSQVLSLICKEFNVNELWLRTGEGEMFVQVSRDEEITAFVGKMLSGETSTFKRRLISVLAQLNEDDWVSIECRLKEIVNGHIEPVPAPQPLGISREDEIEAEVENYRQELLAEAKGAVESSAFPPARDA